jgi:predicted alpha/beta superfamily hydrolase
MIRSFRFASCLGLGALMLSTTTPVAARSRPAPRPAPAAAASVWYSEQFTLHSRSTGRDYLIQVAKPFLAAGAKAPAIYLLDGNLDFGLAERIVGPDGAVGTMLPALIVGIGYPAQAKPDWLARRTRDLAFVPVAGTIDQPEGAAFQRFLTEELRPLIEARYAADPHRAILAGQSLGGLFAAHVLVDTPQAFDGYVICSPSLWAEPGLIDRAKAMRAVAKLPVFLGVGEQEATQEGDKYHMVSNAKALADVLGKRDANLDFRFGIVPEENHYTVTVPFYARAFRFMLTPRGS